MKKTAAFLLCMLSAFTARADSDAFYGWMKVGSFGDILYRRNDAGKIVKKRTDDEIKSYIATTVNDTLKTRGLSVFKDRKNQDVQKAVTVSLEQISFNAYDQSGNILFPFVIDRKKSLLLTEIPTVEQRAASATAKASSDRYKQEETLRRKAVFDKIKRKEKKK